MKFPTASATLVTAAEQVLVVLPDTLANIRHAQAALIQLVNKILPYMILLTHGVLEVDPGSETVA